MSNRPSPLELLSLVRASLYYDWGGDTDRSRVLKAFIYGRYYMNGIGYANARAWTSVERTMNGYTTENQETLKRLAFSNARTQIGIVGGEIDDGERGRFSVLLNMLGITGVYWARTMSNLGDYRVQSAFA
jgi:hypothetical protein